MDITLQIVETFSIDLMHVPRKVQEKINKDVYRRLKQHPDEPTPPVIKKLKGWKYYWRYRISDDWRLIYAFDQSERTITCLMLGHRRDIYKRLGHNDSGPTARIVANSDLAPYLEEPVTDTARIQAAISASDDDGKINPSGQPEAEIPQRLTRQDLLRLGVPEQYHVSVLAVKTENELEDLRLSMPEIYVLRIIEYLWPSTIERVTQAPVRIVENEDDFERIARGELTLEALLLKLDDEQKVFVTRFETGLPIGPWMIKGGPGSGKTTVALHCVRGLMQQSAGTLALPGQTIRVLFTTYTKSLVASAKHLIHSMGLGKSDFEINVINVDKLLYSMLPKVWRDLTLIKGQQQHDIFKKILQRNEQADNNSLFKQDDHSFIEDEIEWVIIGEDLRTEQEYLEFDRRGRGRRLDQRQRKAIWNIYELLLDELREKRSCFFAQWHRGASKNVKPMYDYVFIDEAQDVKTAVLRLLLKLAKDERNVFLMADSNQTIYSATPTWQRAAENLNFRGRSRVLRKNYRTTFETWEAIGSITQGLADTDNETMDAEPVYHGPIPSLKFYASLHHEVKVLDQWIRQALMHERLPRNCVAVLCPTNQHCSNVAALMDSSLNAKAFTTDDIDYTHDGIIVMTMHAAKGLQFPIVAVTGLEQGVFPQAAHGGVDPDEFTQKQRRLFFVASSRAMRRLLVCASERRPSEFVELLDKDQWDLGD